jgi:DNA-binding transcriptional regulator YiaG
MKTALGEAMKTTKVRVTIPTLDGEAIAEVVVVEVPCTIDESSGEELLGAEALEMIDRVKARHMGLMQPTDIRRLRKLLCVSQRSMSELLQIGAKSYTRWESGRERPSRSLNILLRALWDGKLDVNYLESIRSAEFNWGPAVLRLHEIRLPVPYTVDVSEDEETCRETKRPAA